MRILFISCHPFLPSTRKTSVHFISEALAQRGHRVSTISVGFSALSYFRDSRLYRTLVAEQGNRFVERTPFYRSACYLPALHPFSAKSAALNHLTSLFFRLYARALPKFMKEAFRSSEVVFLEGGTSICFFDAIRRYSPDAQRIYFRRDHLESIGASPYLVEEERRIAEMFDHVYVPARCMTQQLPARTKVSFLPQGIDKNAFDRCETTPYPTGSRNAVVVGNMLFDAEPVAAMAKSAPNVRFHLFGSGMAGAFPKNVTRYGERSHADTVPYIKFADFGIAPYKMSSREDYLAQSSLKLLQYSYCLLPVVAPDALAGSRDNLVLYRQGKEDDWPAVVRRALDARRSSSWQEGVLSWEDLAAALEVHLKALRRERPQNARSEAARGQPAATLAATSGRAHHLCVPSVIG